MASTTSKVREKERTDETPLEAFFHPGKKDCQRGRCLRQFNDFYEVFTNL
jgi:hypothetical protein